MTVQINEGPPIFSMHPGDVSSGMKPGGPAALLVARLRAETAANQDKTAQALLLHECAVIEEASGEEATAARDYLAAYNLDPQFREPLEALVRILSRRKSVKNLGKLLDALTRSALTPDERARAMWERAAYLQAHDKNVAGAKELFDEAIGGAQEEPVLWLELELCAAKLGDPEARMQALEVRAELAIDPTWKALLHLDLAELAVTSGDTARAYDLLGAASALEGRARFRSLLVLEQLAQKESNLEALARALEGQADLIEEAIDDAVCGDATGVPRYVRRPDYAADAWFRAAAVQRRMGDEKAAAAMVERAGRRLPESAVIVHARIASLEAGGDVEGAAALALTELGRGIGGHGAAALWLRIAEAAAVAKDRDRALDALRRALVLDRDSIPARALELDRLADGKDPAALATSLEAMAETFSTPEPKGRALLLAAYVWGADASDPTVSRGALARAAMCGVPAAVIARTARSLAALCGDAAWYEEGTQALLASAQAPGDAPSPVAPDAGELASLWLELGRIKLLRGDTAGAEAAFAHLAGTGAADSGAAWLGRVLGAYAVGMSAGARAEGDPALRLPDAIEHLARVEPDAAMARALWVVAALRSARFGDVDRARERLRALVHAAPGDRVVAIFLAELDRRAGDVASAAAILAGCASRAEAWGDADPELAAALHLEAALLLWPLGDRAGAIAQLEAAREHAPRGAAVMLAWALRGADPDTLEGRRRAIEAASDAGAPAGSIALERFGLESAVGDPDAALSALVELENESAGDLALAAALARLLWPTARDDAAATGRALEQLEALGDDGAAIAYAERFRVARTIDGDRLATAAAAEAWSEADPKLYSALEWIAAALAAEDREGEIAARRASAKHFDGPARAAMAASAALVAMLDQPTLPQRFVQSEDAPAKLMNLELAQPGCDPRRRAAALHGLGASLGDDTQLDAMALGGWSDLAAGSFEEAREAFRAVIERRADDIPSWEGVRSASEALGDHVQTALACAQLGALCRDAARGAEFWERAGMILLDHTAAKDDAEIAFSRSFDRDPRRPVAFDKLFRSVRARNEDPLLLTIIERRLDVADDEHEIGKLYWERARVLRKQGNLDAALAALADVTTLEPDHVGALALLSEICITKGKFSEAAPHLARLATIAEAPKQQRLMSGIAAVDLFENKLGQPEKALEVLVQLHKDGLSNLPVRERLARVAARAGAWNEATTILEALMNERDKREGRIEAARLAMSIWRDKLLAPARAQVAVTKLLDEAPDDTEAIDYVMATPFDAAFKANALSRAKQALLAALAVNPVDAGRLELLAKLAQSAQDSALRQAALGCLVALGHNTQDISAELGRLDARVATRPQIALDARTLDEIADPGDAGPIAELMPLMAETAMLALGPSLTSLGIAKKDRIDPRGGHPLRVAVAEWMGALGMSGDFELYVGGPEPRAVHGIPGDLPAIVLGAGIATPLDAAARSAVAREVFALRRGTTAVRTRDDSTMASLVIAACIESGVNVPPPAYAAFAEVSRAVHKELPRKVRKMTPEICQRVAAGHHDARQWAAAARRSVDRMAVIAAGDVSIVLSDILKAQRTELGTLVGDSDRARPLLAFVLSPSYLELRKKLGMGVR